MEKGKKYDNKKGEKIINNELINNYKDKYNSVIKLTDTINLIDNIIKNKKDIKFVYENSSMNNLIDIINIKYNLNINKTKTICSVFKIKKSKDIINYSYLFSKYDNVELEKYKECKKKNKKYDISKILKHGFISTSPNLISADGEFRRRLIQLSNLCLLDNYTKLVNYIEKYIYEKFENEDIEILFEYFNTYDKDIEELLYKYITSTKISIKLFIISWICEINNIINDTKSININEDYYDIMYTKKDIKMFENYIKENDNKNIINEFVKDFTQINLISNNLELSQKIIPQTNYEFKNYSKLITGIGTELLINNIVTDLKYNFVSESFSLFYNWFFISNSKMTLYDNKNIIKLIQYNEFNKRILTYLYNSKIELKDINKNEDIINKNHYIKLLTNVKNNITLTEKKLLMSDVSTCFVFEYIGKTFYNNISDDLIYNRIFLDYKLFSKLLFDIIYGLYCLNINGIIHGDLHLNNITINDRYKHDKDSYVVYNLNSNIHDNYSGYIYNSSDIDINVTNNKKNIYIFPDIQYTACIIDYSRSYILLKAIKNNILEKYKNKSRQEYIKKEKIRYIHELTSLFPNYVNNNKHKIDILFNTKNFEIFFKFFSAIDIFKFSSNTILYLENKKKPYDKKIKELLTNISKDSFKSLEKIINDKYYLDSNEYKYYPNYVLLQKYFKEFTISDYEDKKKKINITNITNIFNINNIMNKKSISKKNYYKFQFNKEDINIINNSGNVNYNSNFKIDDDDINIETFISENLYNYKFNIENDIDGTIQSSILNLTDTLLDD